MPRNRFIPALALAGLLLAGCSGGRGASISVRLDYPQDGAAPASAGADGAARAASGGTAAPAYVKLPANRILIRVLAPHIPTPIEAWFDRAAGRGEITGIPPGDRIVVEVDEYDNTAVALGTDAPLLGRGWAQGVTLAAGESKTVTVPMYGKGTIVRVCGADNTAGGGSGTAGDSGDGGLAADALLGQPLAVKVGPGDAVFVSSAMYNRIRRIDRYGYIGHYAGNGSHGTLIEGSAAATAPIGGAFDIDIVPSGDLYLINNWQEIVRVNSSTGTLSIKYGGQPFNSAAEPNLAVLDDNTVFYTNAMENRVYFVQGNARSEYVIDNSLLVTDPEGALPTSTVVKSPSGVTFDSESNGLIYGSKDSNRIKRLDLAAERVFTFVGSASPVSFFEGIARTDLAPQKPDFVEMDRFGGMRLFFSEQNSNTIKYVKLDVSPNTVWILAGSGTPGYSGDGWPATAARLNTPRSVATDSRGNVYIADTGNHAIRMVVGGALP